MGRHHLRLLGVESWLFRLLALGSRYFKLRSLGSRQLKLLGLLGLLLLLTYSAIRTLTLKNFWRLGQDRLEDELLPVVKRLDGVVFTAARSEQLLTFGALSYSGIAPSSEIARRFQSPAFNSRSEDNSKRRSPDQANVGVYTTNSADISNLLDASVNALPSIKDFSLSPQDKPMATQKKFLFHDSPKERNIIHQNTSDDLGNSEDTTSTVWSTVGDSSVVGSFHEQNEEQEKYSWLPSSGPHPPGLPAVSRYLVYLCNQSRGRCGGWADRQRGMLSVFLLARVTGRIFKVDMQTPCNISNFLQPVGLDWWGKDEQMASSDAAVVNDIRWPVLPRLVLNNVDLNRRFPQSILYVQTTRDIVPLLALSVRYNRFLPGWARHISQALRFRLGWQQLAKPTPSITSRLQSLFQYMNHTAKDNENRNRQVKDEMFKPVVYNATNDTGLQRSSPESGQDLGGLRLRGHNLVCAHLRMGRNPSMPNDASVRNNKSAVQITFNFLEQLLEGNNAFVFISTDDQDVRAAARKRFGVRLLDHGGTIIHIDRQGTLLHACAGFETAIIDQLVLSECDVLVMSRSGFSRHAAYLRQHSHGLFLLQNGQITPSGFQ